ncbi:hypothetical protein U1Q18_025181, partial [Sarracenia purpurea var. burkii]
MMNRVGSSHNPSPNSLKLLAKSGGKTTRSSGKRPKRKIEEKKGPSGTRDENPTQGEGVEQLEESYMHIDSIAGSKRKSSSSFEAFTSEEIRTINAKRKKPST